MLLFSLKIFFETLFQEYFVGPDLGPICLQILSADGTRRQRGNSGGK